MTAYENTAILLKSENKKQLFVNLYFASKMSRLDSSAGVAGVISEFLTDCSTSFVQDIAKKYGTVSMSEKQIWCMIFEAIKIQHMFDAWVESELSTL